MTESKICTCPSGDGSLRWPCPAHPAVDQADVAAKLTFINGRPAMCGCQVEYSDGGGEYSDVIYVTLCAKHSGSAILDLVATNRIALTPEYEGQWHADLYLDREIPLAKVEGATPAEAVLALMSAERIDPEQESVEQAGGDERAAFKTAYLAEFDCDADGDDNMAHSNTAWRAWKMARAALAQPSPDAPYADGIAADLERSDWTPEDALRWYAAGKHFDTVNGRTRIIDTGAVASNALKHLSLPYLEMKGDAELTELREAFAQPSPTTDSRPAEWSSYDPTWVVDFIRDNSIFNADLIERMLEYATRPAGDVPQAEQAEAEAEAERPEVVARVDGTDEDWFIQPEDETELHNEGLLFAGCELGRMIDFDRIVGALRAENAKLIEALDECDGDRWRLRSERDAALARVAELERQEPVAWMHDQPNRVDVIHRDVKDLLQRVPGSSRGIHRPLDVSEHYTIPLYAAPVAQAQHSVPEGWMLVECGIWTQEQVDEMQKTVARFRNSEFVDDRALAMAVADAGQCKAPEISLAELLAGAPGKEVGHE